MAYTPEYVTAPDGRQFRVGSPTEREQLLAQGYRLSPAAQDFIEDVRAIEESKPEPKTAAKDKPTVQAATPAIETSKPASK